MDRAVVISPRERYAAELASGELLPDPVQQQAVDALQEVYEQLCAQPPRRFLGRRARNWPAVPGLYFWGGVGRGKTHLMDLFCDALGEIPKLRTHFHRFMLDMQARRNRYPNERDPLQRVADDVASEVRVLCFDEFFVSDIADAMILGRLFEALFARGVTLVATSNVAPDNLYRDGLQRQQFLPAIATLKQNVTVMNVDSGIDYRLRALHAVELYLSPCDADAMRRLDKHYHALAPHGTGEARDISLNDRRLHVLRMSNDGVAWFDFKTLCEGPRSAADYIALAEQFHTLILSNVPSLTGDRDDSARRFITLIDELYDRSVKLVLAAAAPLDELYCGSRLKFEFQRTRSRLTEMQSEEYLAQPHRRGG